MKSLQSLTMTALILLSIQSCSNLKQSPESSLSIPRKNDGPELVHAADKVSVVVPNIPFNAYDAFYPLSRDGSGVEYKWRECEKRVIFCVKWKQKKVVFRFDDKEIMRWFISNDFGFKKREKP